ncbi:MAG: amidohydrolase [Planctomycetota bacterium]
MLAAICVAAVAAGPTPAGLVVTNARIFSDGLPALAESFTVRDGRFVAVGEPPDEIRGDDRHIDAGGRVIVPGLIDAHIHMLSGGANLPQLQLRDAGSREEFVQRIREWASDLEPGQWILGGRWSTESWDDPTQPTRAWVDEASGGHPLFLSRMDGHSALVNTRALELAGITAEGPPDPPAGVIDRDPVSGEPTGILREGAMDLVSRLVPSLNVSYRVEALRKAVAEALRSGITAVGDIPDIGDLEVYERLAAEGSTIRFFLYPTATDWVAAARDVARFRGRPGWVEVRGLKDYMDGSLGSRTAYMHEPYLDGSPRGRGLLRDGVEEGRLAVNLAAACEAGLQPIVHAIGDEANHLLLNMYLASCPGVLRPRCEHVQHLLPEDIARFGSRGVIASMQPFHKADDGRYAESRIGADRARSSYAFKSLLDAGAVVAFGSDWPVVTLNPFKGMEAAVTGRILDGSVWQPQENITVAEALRCYTSRAAYAVFAERELGRIAPGYRADFVILEGSPFDVNPDWDAIRPHEVYVEGRLVFESR